MSLQHVHIAAIVLALVAVALAAVNRAATMRRLRIFFLEPGAAFNLAALRIFIFGMLLKLVGEAKAPWFAGLPKSVRELPPGWGWADALPVDPATVSHVQTALLVSGGLALIGLGTRITAPLTALLSVYVLGVPNFFFKIDHSAHATVMCALIVAFAPCGDALSVDWLIRRLRGYAAPTLSRVYSLPVRFCWLILGTVYWFPGFWKLRLSGDLWLRGVQLQGELHEKWGQLENFVPPFRLDQQPLLLAVLGVMTLVFELGFVFALFWRPSRVIAALSAVSFHLGVLWIMNIHFNAVLPLILLLDFPQLWQWIAPHLPAGIGTNLDAQLARWFRPLQRNAPAGDTTAIAWPGRRAALSCTVACLLLLGQVITGLGNISSWPVTVHPTFSGRHDDSLSTTSRVFVVLETSSGEEHDLHEPLKTMGRARLFKMLKTLNTSRSNRAALRRYGDVLSQVLKMCGAKVAPTDHVVVYNATWNLFPLNRYENYSREPVARFKVTEAGDLELAQARREARRAAPPEKSP